MATVFGLGYVPKASGTWGTLAAIPLVFIFQGLGEMGYLIAAGVLSVLGIFCAGVYCRSTEKSDPQEIIIDEVAGYVIAMAWLPFNWIFVIGTFLVFRFLDIVKPPPVSFFDIKNRGGVGVMADDLVAGILVNILFQWIHQTGVLNQWI